MKPEAFQDSATITNSFSCFDMFIINFVSRTICLCKPIKLFYVEILG